MNDDVCTTLFEMVVFRGKGDSVMSEKEAVRSSANHTVHRANLLHFENKVVL